MATTKRTANSKPTGTRPAGSKPAGAASARKPAGARRTASAGEEQAQAEHLARSLGESAHQIWLAGVGAFGRAQAEGTRLFETLAREGAGMEKSARRFAGGRAEEVREAVEQRVGQARERAADTWDRFEKVFEDRVHRALVGLGVPARDDLAELNRKVDELTAELRRQRTGTVKRAAPAKRATTAAGRKPAAPRTASKSTGPAAKRARKTPPPTR